MTSREKVLNAINHVQPDKIPIDLGASTVTGISAIAYNKLKAHINLDAPTQVFDVIQQLAQVDESILKSFQVDATMVYDAADYTQRTYYLNDATLSNQTQIIDLYLINDSDGILVNINLVDATHLSIEDAYINILRQYVGENTFRTIAIARTDLLINASQLYTRSLQDVEN